MMAILTGSAAASPARRHAALASTGNAQSFLMAFLLRVMCLFLPHAVVELCEAA
jgi:hypothetical protein